MPLSSFSRPALVVPKTVPMANVNQAVALVRCQDYLQPSYFMHLFLSPQMQVVVHGSKVETARPNISLEDLRGLLVPFPPPKEQCIIVEEIERCFSAVADVENTLEQSISQSDRLWRSILKRAFEGKLVPQDPSDEPAEELLERIKAERAKVTERAKGTKESKVRMRKRGEK